MFYCIRVTADWEKLFRISKPSSLGCEIAKVISYSHDDPSTLMTIWLKHCCAIYFFVNWVEKYHRNPDINDRDHLVGQLTTLTHTHSSSFLLISTSTIVLLTFSNTKQLCVPALTASWMKPWQTEDTATSKRNIRRAEGHGNLLDVYICLNFSSYVHFCPIVCTFTHAWNRSYSTINIFAPRHAHERAKYLNTLRMRELMRLFCWP